MRDSTEEGMPPCCDKLALLLGAACFIVGVLFEYVFGTRGYMPLDHSIVFDGGWRILSGQTLWRDFDMPSSVTASFIQALFFKIGGVTWGSYVAHAAVLNGVFCSLVFGFLARLGMRLPLAALYGAASGALLFAPVGVPFPDQHSFFFAFLGLWLFLIGRTATRKWLAITALSLVPLVLLFGFLSKQLPTGLSPLVMALLLALPMTRPRKDVFLGLGLGVLVAVTFAGAFLLSTGVELDSVRHALFEVPMAAGERRLGLLPSAAKLPMLILEVGLAQGMWSVVLMHTLCLGLSILVFAQKRKGWLRALGLLVLAETIFQVDVIAIVLANNQDGIGVAWFFVALGVAHVGLTQVDFGSQTPRHVPTVLGAAVLLLLARDVVHFSATVNSTRTANDMQFDPDLAASAHLPDSLAPLQWTLPDHHGYSSEDFVAVLDYLNQSEGDFLLVGDPSILYGLTGKRSVPPSVWYHPGVSLPMPGGPAFREWQKRLVANMRPIAGDKGREEVLRIVEERAGTWVRNWKLRDMPIVWRDVKGRILSEVDLGAFRVLELRPK